MRSRPSSYRNLQFALLDCTPLVEGVDCFLLDQTSSHELALRVELDPNPNIHFLNMVLEPNESLFFVYPMLGSHIMFLLLQMSSMGFAEGGKDVRVSYII